MTPRNKSEKSNGLFPKFYSQNLTLNEKGQTLIEYVNVLGISGAISGVIAFFRDYSVIVTAIIIALLIFLLFWKS